MSPKARDLGEPLEIALLGKAEIPIVRDKRECTMLKEDLQIVVDRANALQGCPDPEALRNDLMKLKRMADPEGSEIDEDLLRHVVNFLDEQSWLREVPE